MLELKITAIKKETHDCKTFVVKPVGAQQQLEYKAGQFLTLLLTHAGREVRRSYSLGCTPGVDHEIFFTVKRKVNGEISRHLLDHYNVGDTLKALEPSGRFVIEKPYVNHYFFIAAGSGFVPVFSLMKEALHHHKNANVSLIYQSLDEHAVIYEKQLHQLQHAFKERLQVTHLFSQPKHQQFAKRLNNTMLENILQSSISNRHDVQFFICGPVPFMRMAQFTLKLLGYTEAQIKQEYFVIEQPPPAPLMTDTSAKNVTIHFNNKTHAITVAYPQNILDAALKQNINLPYSCKGGRCSTCTAKCLNGNVVMSMNEVLTEKDITNGLVLTCVGYAATDVELSFENIS